ncbi:MAG: hypothetical protein ACYTGZ_09270 [Planctomycetota bacterium]
MPEHPKRADLETLLDALREADVEFIVVGGAAAVLHGAPITTQDVDVVHRTDPANIEKLLSVLRRLDARIRDLACRDIEPDAALLAGTGQVKLTTSRGPLDLLCSLHDGRGYGDLVAHSVKLTDGSIELHVLDLPTLIEIKSGTGRVRDQLVLPLLLALQRKQSAE